MAECQRAVCLHVSFKVVNLEETNSYNFDYSGLVNCGRKNFVQSPNRGS